MLFLTWKDRISYNANKWTFFFQRNFYFFERQYCYFRNSFTESDRWKAELIESLGNILFIDFAHLHWLYFLLIQFKEALFFLVKPWVSKIALSKFLFLLTGRNSTENSRLFGHPYYSALQKMKNFGSGRVLCRLNLDAYLWDKTFYIYAIIY